MAQRSSEWDDDGYDDERPAKKSGWSLGKILGLGCLILIILGAACGVYVWRQMDEVLHQSIVRSVQKTKDGTGGLTSGERNQVSRLLDQVKSLSRNGDLKFTTAGLVVGNLQNVSKDMVLEKHEVEPLLKFLQAVIDAKGDIGFSKLDQYNMDDHPPIRPTEGR